MKITLYHSPIACSMVPYIALEEAAAEFEVHVVNVLRGEQMTAEYLRLNPKHRVPLLAVDDHLLTENVAINQWIARSYPVARLLPAGFDEFRAISLMAWFAAGIHPTLTPNLLPHRYCDIPGTENNVRECARRIFREYMSIIDAMLESREWFFATFTICDAYFFWCVRRAKQFDIDMSTYLSCEKHFDRVSVRPSVRKVLQHETDLLGAHQR